MAQEMGKPLAQGRGEVEKCAWACEYYADHAEGFLAPEPVETDALRSYVAYRPIGIVFAIMPWNFPFWQVLRFAAPTLVGGNAALLKHAPNVPGCALAIEKLLPRRRLSRRALPDAGDLRRAGQVRHPTQARGGRYPDRQHRGRKGGGQGGRRASQEVRPRAGRERSIPGAGGCRSRGGDRGVRHQPTDQLRAELHRREAVRRGGVGAGGIRATAAWNG